MLNERTLPPLWVKGRWTNWAGLTFSKNMTSYSTEVRLRCRGASQETERLLSSLCVRINWDTVTGAAVGENREHEGETKTKCKLCPLSTRSGHTMHLELSLTVTVIFLLCGRREMRSLVVINCFLWIVHFCSNSGSVTLFGPQNKICVPRNYIY